MLVLVSLCSLSSSEVGKVVWFAGGGCARESTETHNNQNNIKHRRSARCACANKSLTRFVPFQVVRPTTRFPRQPSALQVSPRRVLTPHLPADSQAEHIGLGFAPKQARCNASLGFVGSPKVEVPLPASCVLSS